MTVGTKLFIIGAELGGNTEPCHPFEVCTCLVLVFKGLSCSSVTSMHYHGVS